MKQSTIHIDPQIMSGTPVFRGTRVPVKNLFDYLEAGDSIDVFLSDFEGETREQVLNVLSVSQRLIDSLPTILNENTA